MKRFLVLVSCVVLLAAACSSANGSGDSAAEPPSTSVAASDTPSAQVPDTSIPTTTSTTTETTTTTTATTAAPPPPEPAVTPEPSVEAPAEPVAWTHFPGAAATDRGAVADIDVNPDGTTWALTELDAETDGNAFALSRFESGEWVTHPGPVLARETRMFEGFFGPLGPYFAAGPEGTAWVLDVRWADEQQLESAADLWKFEGDTWDVIQGVEAIGPELSGRIRAIDVGGDGVLWVRVDVLIAGYLSILEPGLFMSFDDRVPGGEWSEYPEPDIGACGAMCRAPESDRSGTLWTFTADGIARLDGSEWTFLSREPEYASPNWSTREDIAFVADDGIKWATLGREADGVGPQFELMSQVFVDDAWTTWPAEGANAAWTDAVAEVQGRYGFVAGMTGISDQHLFVSGGANLFWFEVGGGFELLDVGVEITALASADGSIWVGTREGLSRFDPAAW